MKIFTPKLIRKIFATMVVSGLIAGMTITVYATGGVTLSSRGNISYNADGEGDPDVYFSSSDLENLNTSLSTVNSSVTALSSRVGAAEADVTTIKNALGGSSGTELTTVMQNLLTGLNAKTGQSASTLQAAVNGMADPGNNVKYPALTPTGRQETEYGVVGTLNGYYNNKNLKILQGSNYGINATHAYENMYEDGKTVSSETSAPYVTDSDETHAGVLTITPPAGYYDGEKSIYVDTKEIVDNGQYEEELGWPERVGYLTNAAIGDFYYTPNPYTGQGMTISADSYYAGNGAWYPGYPFVASQTYNSNGWQSNGSYGSPMWLKWKFNNDIPNICAFIIQIADHNSAYTVKLQYSDDDSNWTDVKEYNPSGYSGAHPSDIWLLNGNFGTHQYWRLYAPLGMGIVQSLAMFKKPN